MSCLDVYLDKRGASYDLVRALTLDNYVCEVQSRHEGLDVRVNLKWTLNDEPIGIGWFYLFADHSIYVGGLYLDKDHQGKGIMTNMLKSTVWSAIGIHKGYIGATDDSKAIFVKAGFKPTDAAIIVGGHPFVFEAVPCE
jgi:GNAT superfamily N-acetyltransferase